MSIEKRAIAILTDVHMLGESQGGVAKFAAARLSIDAHARAKQIVDAEVVKHPTALFFRAKAIVADETNSNGDYFSSEELIKGASTFVGVPFYTNHENQDITKAKGKIVFSEWDEKDKAIYVIGFIDREAYPGLCRGVEQDYMRGVSMGCVVEYSECSICDNQASTVEEYCPHIKFRKGRTFSGTAKSVKTGEIRNFSSAKVYERNFGIRFIELSGVGDPACKSCFIQGVYDNGNMAKAASCGFGSTIGYGSGFMSKVACVENSLMMYRGTDLYKKASQQELQQIEQVLATLEQISVGLIKNRKRVEVEFASDLVKILSELQEFADELTGAGYGQLEGEPGGDAAAGDIGSLEGIDSGLGGEAPIPGPAEGVPSASGATGMPVSDPLGGAASGLGGLDSGVGSISGSPSNPVVSAPRMPSAPKKPLASGDERLKRVAELVGSVRAALVAEGKNNGGEEEMNRRTPTMASQERTSIRQALSGSTKESSTVSENVVYHGNSAKASGGSNMSDTIVQKAARTDAPSVLPEKQLDAGLANHPRTGVEQDSTQQVQLEGKRLDSEYQTTTEDQINGQRTGDAPGVLPEKQLAGHRKDSEPTATQQVQLESKRTGTEQDRLTEVQLEGKQADLYARASMRRENLKTADQHASAVIRVLAESAVRCSATPQQIREAASTLVDGTKARSTTLDLVTSAAKKGSEQASPSIVVARARYWGTKGVTLASATTDDMSSDIVAGLRTLVANDFEISPEAVMDVLDVVSAEDDSIEALSGAIDDVVAEPQAVAASSSMKKQIRAAVLAQTKVEHVLEPEPMEPAPLGGEFKRAKERGEMKAALASSMAAKKPTHIIEASLKEIGTTLDELRNNKQAAKRKIVAFVKNVSAMNNLTVEQRKVGSDGKPILVAGKVGSLRVANITNVTVDGAEGTVQIAIQTDDGDTSADITVPLDEQGAGVEGAPAEGDATGEGLDGLIGGAGAEGVGGMEGASTGMPLSSDAGLPPAPPAANSPLPTAAAKGRTVRTAQFGGGGGGMPGGGNLGGAQDPGSGLPQGMPAMDSGEGLQNFTENEGDEDEEKAPGVGEQMMPGSICPFCHGSDTTTGKKELPPGAFECNNCGAVYEVHVNIEVLNPEGMSFEKGEGPDEITEPKLPEMPVAASIRLDKAGLEKIASCEQKYGHVCPACGMTECKPQEKTAGKVVYVCPSCETKSTKEILVASDKSAFLQVEWNLNPKKVFSAGCKTCKQAALEYSALVKITGMMRKASEAGKNPKTAFPMANCAEYVARRFGSNAVATFGPCKGKPLADCACKQLESFGLRKRIDVEKLASVYAQPDPMEKCHEIQKGKGYKQAQADVICNAMKKKYAKESDDNEWLEAFAGDSRFTTEELRVMKQKASAMLSKGAQMGDIGDMNLDADLGAPLDDVQPVGDEVGSGEEFADETVTVEIPADLARDLAGQIETQTDEGGELEGTVDEDMPEDIAPPTDIDITARGKGNVRTAATPKQVEDISSGVEGKLKGGTGTIGNEQAFNAQKPSIPSRGNASRIKGEQDTIGEAKLPDIAAGSSTMGDEANTLKGTPPVSTEMRGRVISKSGPNAMSRVAKQPTQVEDISSGVEGKLKGGTGTIGNEQSFDAKDPTIPSRGSSSEIGGEKDTIPEAGLPDIPADSATMGDEANTLKGTPPVSTEIRGRVLADTKRDQQLDKIAAARHKKACQVAARLMGLGHISDSDYDSVVEDLAKIEVNRIDAFAERMFRNVRTAAAAPVMLSTPIVQEASAYRPVMPKTMADQLKGIFTIGTPQLHQRVLEDDRRDDAEAQQ